MKTLLLILLLALPIHAAPQKPPAKSVPMAKQRTLQEDLELRDWIVGIQTLAAEAVKKADEAEVEAKESRAQSIEAAKELGIVQLKYDEKAAEVIREKERAEKQQKRAEIAEAHLSRLKTSLAMALAVVLVGLVQFLPFGWIRNPLYSIGARIVVSGMAAALAWWIVARYA